MRTRRPDGGSRPRASALPTVFATLFLGAGALALSGCSHSRPAPSASAKSGKSDSAAEAAVAATDIDERMAPVIQREMNELFFEAKRVRPGGVDAFSADRITELENAMAASESKALRYFLANREFFDRVEDAGGGFRVLSNGRRLASYRWTKPGRRKLFAMDTVRVREAIANPCFPEVDECGESSSDAEENMELLRSWASKYPEKEFAPERGALLKEYLAQLRGYEKRRKRGKGAAKRISQHRREVEGWIEEAKR